MKATVERFKHGPFAWSIFFYADKWPFTALSVVRFAWTEPGAQRKAARLVRRWSA